MILFADDGAAVNPWSVVGVIVAALGSGGVLSWLLNLYQKWQERKEKDRLNTKEDVADARANARKDRDDKIEEYEKFNRLNGERITKLEIKIEECEKEKGALEIRCSKLETQHDYMLGYLVDKGMQPPAWFTGGGSANHTPLPVSNL